MKFTRREVRELLEQAGEVTPPAPAATYVDELEAKLRGRPFARRPVASGPVRAPADDAPAAVVVRMPKWPAVAAALLLVAAGIVVSTQKDRGIVGFFAGERSSPTTVAGPVTPTTARPPKPGQPSTTVASPSPTTTVTTQPTPTTVALPPRIITTSTTQLPTPTLILTAASGGPGTHVSLSWTPYKGTAFDSYVILRATAPDQPAYPADQHTTVLGTIRTQSQTAWDDLPPADKGQTLYMIVAITSDGHELGRTNVAQPSTKAS
jgi:hypothetical protein